MFRRILVLPHVAASAQPALERAAQCATQNTEIVLLDVVNEPAPEGHLGDGDEVYAPQPNRVLAERQERVSALAGAFAARGLDVVAKAVWSRQREAVVNQYVESQQVDLVVTAPVDGSRGALSSSDWRLVSHCAAPVLIVRDPAPKEQYRNIVAAVDPFHAHAKPPALDIAILSAAVKLQAKTRAKLTVLHCFTPPEFFRADARLAPRDDEIEKTRREALEDVLREAAMPTSGARVVVGQPYAILEEMAERGEVDVIVMGVLTRGRVKDWLIGSTAERVLQRTRVDVLAVNPPR